MPAASLVATRAAKPETAPVSPDLEVIKTRQQAAWSSGNYAVVGTTLQIVGEELCEALDLRPGRKVLDVAAGNGDGEPRRGTPLVRRGLDRLCVESCLERGRARAAADGLPIEFKEADAEALPFARQIIRYRDLDLRRDVHAQSGPGRGGIAARLQAGRPDRPRKLDAGRLHRPGVQDDRQILAASGRREIAGAVGNACASHRNVRTGRDLDQDRAAPFQFPLPFGRALLDVFRNYYGPMVKAFAALDGRSRPSSRRTCTSSSRA